MMANDYSIKLNFMPFEPDIPNFYVYRNLRQSPQEQHPEDREIRAYSLPFDQTNAEDRGHFWVSTQAHDGYEKCLTSPTSNIQLTKWIIFQCLSQSANINLKPEEAVVLGHGFINEICFPLEIYKEGNQELIVQPYYLRATRSFGLLIDFHFHLSQDIQYSRRVLQLSLSLDQHFKRNFDYYVDRLAKIQKFIDIRWPVLSSITLPGAERPIILNRDFQTVNANLMRSRVYIFANNKESRSQFNGLRDNGPLEPLKLSPLLLFVFREEDRQAARSLAMTLKGSTHYSNFMGFSKLFKIDLKIDSNPVVVKEFSVATSKQVLDRVHSIKDTIVVPIFVLPDNKSTGYYEHKAIFAEEGIATQACVLPTIHDANMLRWSAANIALQIFCKAGGMPWKVRATGDRSLIIGISQSHKLYKTEEKTIVEKYFAFSVLTDNSGLFQKILILGEGNEEHIYLNQLKANLKNILNSNVANYRRIVVHTSFRLKQREINAIHRVVQEAAVNFNATGCHFAVIKVNNKNRFFGFNPHINSLVPYEGTIVRLGKGEYLIWFEGIFPDRTTVTKAFPGPTHIEILKVSDEEKVDEVELLQDLMNLSGANWRGFNAKSTPVSVFYCHLLADLVQEFHSSRLPMPSVEQLSPWFL
jgi:hypothetical protein